MKHSVVIIGGIEERRRTIAGILRAMPFTIAGEIGDVGALRLVAWLAPDVVILDAATPALNPIAVLRAQMSTPMIALAVTDSPQEQRLFLELGALAVARLEQPDTLAHALDLVTRLSDLAGRRPAGAGLLRRRDLPARPAFLTRH
jgi:DNA-binding NarL/FixJ family response regulator